MQTHPNNHYNPLVGNILIQWIISNIPGMELKISHHQHLVLSHRSVCRTSMHEKPYFWRLK